MAAQVGGLRIGSSVDIERSDGRIHSATVVSIDKNKQCILAQWEEQGEVMRKELQFNIVFELNPELRNVNPSSVKKLPRRTQVPVVSANFGANHDRCSLAGPSMPRQSLHDSALRPPPTPVTLVKLRSTSSSKFMASNPHATVRDVAAQVPLSKSTVYGIINDLAFHQYHLNLHECLEDEACTIVSVSRTGPSQKRILLPHPRFTPMPAASDSAPYSPNE
ncbi:uncharacterized protein LOC142583702 [Dermacentor variabilis]|uniref:uncharacterized protein LOC142583702 n=1 Tax=Dermacentor variabilis TaxID=34621 RepID=UPI003F5CB0FC